MNILVTGGCGLIGHNVVNLLEQLGQDVSIIDNRTTYGLVPQDEINYLMHERFKKIRTKSVYKENIETAVTVDYIIKKHQPEIVIHMASFPRQKVVNVNPAWGSRVMMEGLINVLESSKKYNVKKVLYISSSMVYGDFSDYVTEDALCNPICQY